MRGFTHDWLLGYLGADQLAGCAGAVRSVGVSLEMRAGPGGLRLAECRVYRCTACDTLVFVGPARPWRRRAVTSYPASTCTYLKPRRKRP